MQHPPFPDKITKEEINHLPLGGYEGPVTVVRSQEDADEAVARLGEEEVLGFDTETRPSFRKGVSYLPALIQLAGADRAYIFQLKRIRDLAPLFGLLENEAILKAGVGWALDAKELQQVRSFTPRGFVELGDMSTAAGIVNNGLRALTSIILGFRITKGPQRSNWAAEKLSPAQIRYAATDAWVGREIFLRLRERGVEIPPPPPPPEPKEANGDEAGEEAKPRRRRRRRRSRGAQATRPEGEASSS